MSRDPGPARGVLHPARMADHVRHVRLAPSADLEPVVQHFWSVRWDLRGLPPRVQQVLPHPNVHLVFERGGGRVYGVQPRRFDARLEGRGDVFGVKFRPGGFRAYLGAAVAGLRGRMLPWQEIFGEAATGHEAGLLARTDDAGRMACAEALLRAYRRPAAPEAQLAAAIVDDIAADRAVLQVDALAARHGMGVRALQRLFNEYVGIGPKWVINRYRLHEALERAQAGAAVDWTALAHELGYFDQAHFIGDFRAMVGCTPAQYRRRNASAAG